MDIAAEDPVNAPRHDIAAASHVLSEGRQKARRHLRREMLCAWFPIIMLLALSIPGLFVYFSGHG